jgi:uncharacterized tellurite resistance protein B-like protein
MYSQLVKTQEQAICHLFIHCCYKSGEFTESELDVISGKFVQLGLQHDLNFKDELQHYKSYVEMIDTEENYIQYLISLVLPTNELALYSYCLELCISDSLIDDAEAGFLQKLADVLVINDEDQALMQKLFIQRHLVLTQEYF